MASRSGLSVEVGLPDGMRARPARAARLSARGRVPSTGEWRTRASGWLASRIQQLGDGQERLAGGLHHVSETQAVSQTAMLQLMETRLAARGAHVVLSGRDEARLAEVAADCGESLILAFDVRDDAALAEATAKAIAWKGGIDIAFANAGISQRSRALKTSMQVYRDIIEVDLLAQIAFAQGLIGHMAERGSGALGFISSIAGKVGVPMRTAYSAAKFGLAGYADALRGELEAAGFIVEDTLKGMVVRPKGKELA